MRGAFPIIMAASIASWFADVTAYADGTPPVMWADFANERYMVNGQSKAFSDIFTFTRSGSGTYRVLGGLATAASDVPRFEKDPITGDGLGLIREASGTNLVSRSEELENGAWFKSNATVSSNFADAPTVPATTTADKFVENSGAGVHEFIRTSADVSVVSGNLYCVSCCFKAAERTRIGLSLYPVGFAGGTVFVDLTDGSVVGFSGTYFAYGVIPLGNGWYRVWISGYASSTTTSSVINAKLVDTGTNISYTGNGTSGVYVWGMQVEAGPAPSSYIPTTSSALTRAADNCVSSGSKFSSWYTSTAITIYVDWLLRDIIGAKRSVEINDNTNNNRIGPFFSSPSFGGIVSVSGSLIYNSSAGSAVAGQLCKQMLRATNGDQRECANGVLAGAGTGVGHPVCTQLVVGDTFLATQPLNSLVRELRAYPNVVTDSEMQRLTT